MSQDDDGGRERKALISRIGTFFLLLGALAVVLFIASDVGEKTYFQYFFLGIFMVGLGFILKRMSAQPASEGKRFESLRRMRQRSREKKAKKEKK
jgi:hypothetical protein